MKKKLTQKQQKTLNYLLIHNAAREGKLFLVKLLIDLGADIHADDDFALHALQMASKYGHFEIVKYLAELGANIHANDDWAIKNARTTEIKEYLESL